VASDVRVLLGNDELINSIALDVFREYNVDQMVAIALPEASGQVLVTAVGEVDTDQYLDPRTSVVMTVDQIHQKCLEVRPADEHENTPASLKEYRDVLDLEVTSYVEKSYPGAVHAVYGSDKGSKVVTLCIVNTEFSPKNFRNGRWRSVWTATLNQEETEWELEGNIKVLVHYYEEGNVQLNTVHSHHTKIPVQGVDADVGDIIKTIKKVEKAFVMDIEHHFSTLSETSFKELRRTLPLTRTKFQWANQQHSLASELRRSKA